MKLLLFYYYYYFRKNLLFEYKYALYLFFYYCIPDMNNSQVEHSKICVGIAQIIALLLLYSLLRYSVNNSNFFYVVVFALSFPIYVIK